VVARISVVADIAVISIITVIDRTMRRIPAIQQPVFMEDLAEILAVHVNENGLRFHEVANILTSRRMQLTVYEVSDMLAATVEQKLHGCPLTNGVFRILPVFLALAKIEIRTFLN
jgi:hypothetical protein